MAKGTSNVSQTLLRDCIFCHEKVHAHQGKLAINRSNGFGRIGMSHPGCIPNEVKE